MSSLTIFWSWQNNSSKKENRNFIEKCLHLAAKRIHKEHAIVIRIDRDTKNVGGTPVVADSIMTKIRDSDIFVWDETLVYSPPKPSPNPNVLIEFGYALAMLGSGRIIGVMNIANGLGCNDLPFDLKHRRWPITYSLSAPTAGATDLEIEKYSLTKKQVQKDLVDSLSSALTLALRESKQGAFSTDVDYIVAKKYWEIINSSWIENWRSYRSSSAQYELEKNCDRFSDYLHMSNQPQYCFDDATLESSHRDFLKSINKYCNAVYINMTSNMHGSYAVNVKSLSGYIENYDKIYDAQVNAVWNPMEDLLVAWRSYVRMLCVKYPEIIYASPS